MSKSEPAPLFSWLAEPMEGAVSAAIERVRRLEDVRHVAVMPDVHLATGVTVGTVIATQRLLYPQAVGGDIGCGMLACAFDVPAERLADPGIAGRVLAQLGHAVPVLRRNRSRIAPVARELMEMLLSHASFVGAMRDEGVLQLGTLGSGNHFVELQSDEQERLWLMIHSGSRAMGQVIKSHHLAQARAVGGGMYGIDAESAAGRAYAGDVAWARRYAKANRALIAEAVAEVLGEKIVTETLVDVDHNHVAAEEHGGVLFWVHRKGAMPAAMGAAGVLPGSMGMQSFHVEGRGCAQSLCSSAHGAGRAMSREAARRKIRSRDLHRQMERVWYDYRNAERLREEAPAAYKDIRAVLRAQSELVKVTRVLRPVLNYKGT